VLHHFSVGLQAHYQGSRFSNRNAVPVRSGFFTPLGGSVIIIIITEIFRVA